MLARTTINGIKLAAMRCHVFLYISSFGAREREKKKPQAGVFSIESATNAVLQSCGHKMSNPNENAPL